MAFRRESAATVFRKIRAGTYRSHKNGDTRLIEWASVLAYRDACLEQGPQLAPLTGKRGRPKKDASSAAAVATSTCAACSHPKITIAHIICETIRRSASPSWMTAQASLPDAGCAHEADLPSCKGGRG